MTRLKSRIEEGMIAEVKGLLAAGVSSAFLHRLGLEYRFVCRHLEGEFSLEEMTVELHKHICRFAKAQQTWIRAFEKRGWKMTPIGPGDDPAVLFPEIEAWLLA